MCVVIFVPGVLPPALTVCKPLRLDALANEAAIVCASKIGSLLNTLHSNFVFCDWIRPRKRNAVLSEQCFWGPAAKTVPRLGRRCPALAATTQTPGCRCSATAATTMTTGRLQTPSCRAATTMTTGRLQTPRCRAATVNLASNLGRQPLQL